MQLIDSALECKYKLFSGLILNKTHFDWFKYLKKDFGFQKLLNKSKFFLSNLYYIKLRKEVWKASKDGCL